MVDTQTEESPVSCLLHLTPSHCCCSPGFFCGLACFLRPVVCEVLMGGGWGAGLGEGRGNEVEEVEVEVVSLFTDILTCVHWVWRSRGGYYGSYLGELGGKYWVWCWVWAVVSCVLTWLAWRDTEVTRPVVPPQRPTAPPAPSQSSGPARWQWDTLHWPSPPTLCHTTLLHNLDLVTWTNWGHAGQASPLSHLTVSPDLDQNLKYWSVTGDGSATLCRAGGCSTRHHHTRTSDTWVVDRHWASPSSPSSSSSLLPPACHSSKIRPR